MTERLIHHGVPKAVTAVSSVAVRSPKACVALVILISLALPLIGYSTNFVLDVDEFTMFSPTGSLPFKHRKWLEEESGFPPPQNGEFIVLLHANGDNVLSMQGMRHTFEAYDIIRQLPGFYDYCGMPSDDDAPFSTQSNCFISSALRFWNYSQAIFEASVQTDQDVMDTLSQTTFPDGSFVDPSFILGFPEYNDANNTSTITNAQAINNILLFPEEDWLRGYEMELLEALLNLKEVWQEDETTNFVLEVLSNNYSYANEALRAIVNDLDLIPLVFTIMTIFTFILFARRDLVQSRVMLGIGSVFTILCSLMTGYGLMFCCGKLS